MLKLDVKYQAYTMLDLFLFYAKNLHVYHYIKLLILFLPKNLKKNIYINKKK